MQRFTLLLLILLPLVAKTQQYVGSNGFAFLSANYATRSLAVGGNIISISDNDLSLANDNPAVLTEKMNGMIQVNQSILPTGVNIGAFNYAFKTKIGTFAPSIKYINYGAFTETDETGKTTGKFYASDYSIGANYGRTINKVIQIGGNLQFLGSNYDHYTAYGICMGFGAIMQHPNQLLSGGFAVRNLGFVFKEFTGNATTKLPIDVQAAFSFKLKHAPFRFTLLGHHLQQWDIVYQDPNARPTYDALTGDSIPVKLPGFGEKLAHHVNLQVELLASKNFHFRTGFDYHRRQQLKVADRPGLAGFSMGFGLKFKKFSLDYGVLFYSKAGQNHSFALHTQISNWIKKRD